MNLRALHQKAMNVMNGYFRDRGQLPTTIIGLAEDMRMHVMFVPEYPAKRKMFEAFFPAYFFNNKIKAYAYCSEAWMSKRNMDEGYIQPSKDPERVEVLVAGAVDYDQIVSRMYKIDRSGSKPRVGELLYPEDEKFEVHREGMNALLPDPKATVRQDLRNLVDLVISETERRKYFIKTILSQADYENVN